MQGCSSWLSFLLLVAPQLLLILGIKLNAPKDNKEASLKFFPPRVHFDAPATIRLVENGADKIPHSIKLIKKNYIYGNANHKVNVYVKVHRNSPFLVCMDISLSQNDVIDPTYLWIGPNGQILKGKNYVNLTTTGKLMVLGFRERMSGSYTCTLSYRVFRNDMQAEQERFKTFKFMVYAYREPDYTYRMSVHFTTKACNLLANDEFFEELKKILNNLISYLTCHISDPSYKCHSVKRPKHGIGNELFMVFQVNPFARGWDIICHQAPSDCEDVTNSHIRQARWLIEEFFRRQGSVLKHDYQNVPPIRYIDHSFQVTRLDSCRPGFGKNDITHSDCANCCVACDPGTFSPSNEVFCEKCTSIRIKHYGAKSC